MGGSKQKQKSKSQTTYQVSPEQRRIMDTVFKTEFKNGKFKPLTHYDPEKHHALGESQVADFSQDTRDAWDMTRTAATAHRPDMQTAIAGARDGLAKAGSIGQKMSLGTGWSTGADGNAKFMDFNEENIDGLMNPYTGAVIDRGMDRMREERDKALTGNYDRLGSGAFGSRHGVTDSLTHGEFAKASGDFLTSNLSAAYKDATSRYDSLFNQGKTALDYNTGIDKSRVDATGQMAGQLGDLVTRNADLDANGINAVANIGAQQEGREQDIIDAAKATLYADDMNPLNKALMMMGVAPPPNVTTNGTQTTESGGNMWGTMLSTGLKMLPAVMPSDERLKENVKKSDPDDALAAIRKLVPVEYDYNDEGRALGGPEGRRVGYMAQDLEEATGEPSVEMAGGYKGVDIGQELGRLTQAVIALDGKMRALGGKGGRRAAA